VLQQTVVTNKITYINSFDSLRALAAIVVVLFHSGLNTFFKGGWLGVDLFFIMSGYLITSILKKEFLLTSRIDVAHFYLNRVIRLFPPLLMCVLIANVIWAYSSMEVEASRGWATMSSLFYFLNFVRPEFSGNLVHLWSLSVEEHFYLFWPLVVPFLFIFKNNKIRNYLLGAIGIIAIIRIIVYTFRNDLIAEVFFIDPYRFTFCRLDSILCGASLSLGVQNNNASPTSSGKKTTLIVLATLITSFALFLTMSLQSSFWHTGGFIFTNLFFTGVVYLAIKCQHHPILNTPLGTWLGKRSYGIYLYHIPVHSFLDQYRIHKSISGFILSVVLVLIVTITIAALSYTFLELPVAKYKTRLKLRLGYSGL
jgi:peptidoglycan/LPS O-acetylase OafA/YrhL